MAKPGVLTVWNPSNHSETENVRWAWLRSIEWVAWPFFLSQPVVPVLVYYYRWPWVLAGFILAGLAWRTLVVPAWVSPGLASFGCLFVRLKYLAAPVMGYLLWHRGEAPLAIATLLWPLWGPLALGGTTILPLILLEQTPLGRASQIGPVQRRFLEAVGYRATETAEPTE